MRGVVACLASFVTMLALDAPWLFFAGRLLYKPLLGPLLLDKPQLGAALAFYIVYILGVWQIAVVPGFDETSAGRTVMRGALLGLVAYATYDFTNLATLRGWSVTVTIVDLIWGTALTAVAAYSGRYFGRMVGP